MLQGQIAYEYEDGSDYGSPAPGSGSSGSGDAPEAAAAAPPRGADSVPSGAGEGAPGGAGAESQEDEDEDAALARRLQEEEQREVYRRMLEYSGYTQFSQGARRGGPRGPAHAQHFERRMPRAARPPRSSISSCALTHPSVKPPNSDTAGEEEELDIGAMSYENLQALGDVAGTVSKGLAPAAVAGLPLTALAALRAAAAAGGGEVPHMCTICMVDFEEEGESCQLQ